MTRFDGFRLPVGVPELFTAVDDVDDVDVDDCVALEIDRPGAWIKIIVDADVNLAFNCNATKFQQKSTVIEVLSWM